VICVAVVTRPMALTAENPSFGWYELRERVRS
jgi:hypothetical protein